MSWRVRREGVREGGRRRVEGGRKERRTREGEKKKEEGGRERKRGTH